MAVLQKVNGTPFIYFAGCVGAWTLNCSPVTFGRVQISSAYANGVVNVTLTGLELINLRQSMALGDLYYNPRFDVLADGTAILTWEHGHNSGSSAIDVEQVVVTPGPSGLAVGPPVTMFKGGAGTLVQPSRTDYAGSSRDPLRAWQVWYAHQATFTDGSQTFVFGAGAHGP
jgi:hypothetical protein